jgi:hypothetical protein
MGYETYQTLYNNCVTLEMDYQSEVWEYNIYEKINVVQNRGMTHYFGVNKYTPWQVYMVNWDGFTVYIGTG